jgi:hypothetical protein
LERDVGGMLRAPNYAVEYLRVMERFEDEDG